MRSRDRWERAYDAIVDAWLYLIAHASSGDLLMRNCDRRMRLIGQRLYALPR